MKKNDFRHKKFFKAEPMSPGDLIGWFMSSLREKFVMSCLQK